MVANGGRVIGRQEEIMKVLNGFDMASGTRVFDAEHPETRAPFMEDLKSTDTWRKFAGEFGDTKRTGG